jgi:hypothetical protein
MDDYLQETIEEANRVRGASPGKFRIVTADRFCAPAQMSIIGEADDLPTAIERAKSLADPSAMLECYVYDDKGDLVHEGKPQPKQVCWAVKCWAIGGGHPAMTLYRTQSEAEAEWRRLDASDDWTAEPPKRYEIEPGAIPDSETWPLELRWQDTADAEEVKAPSRRS